MDGFTSSPAAIATVLILISAVLHAVLNALIKSAGDRLVSRTLIGVCSAAVAAPFAFFVPFPDPAVWKWLALAALAHSLYQLVQLKSYRYGDLSVVYPVARGLAPPITAFGAFVLFGEALSLLQIAGVLAIGLAVTSLAAGHAGHDHGRRALVYAALTGVMISGYTLVDASGVRSAAHPFTYIVWFFLTFWIPVALFTVLRRGRGLAAAVAREGRRGIIAGLIAVTSYTLALLALRLGATAEIAALREISVIFAAAIGALFLGEGFGARRLAVAAIVAGGAILIRLG